MSDSNRSKSDLIGVIAAGLVAFALGAWLLNATWTLEAEIEHQTAQQAAHYSNPANIPVEGRCLDLAPPDQFKCVTPEREAARDGQRNERDLEAQQKMAVWTRAMGIAAIIGMAVGIVGVGLIFVTFRETKRAAIAAHRSADAFIANERGWLKWGIRSSIPGAAPGFFDVLFLTRVVGKSRIEIENIYWGVLSSPAFPRQFDWQTAELRYRVLEPDSKINGSPITNIEVPTTAEFIGGWIAYRTQFPTEGRSHFLFQLKEVVRERDGKKIVSVDDIDREGWPDDT